MLKQENQIFYYKPIDESLETRGKINDFMVPEDGGYLAEFLKNNALSDEREGYNRTYLVYLKKTNELVAYFSLHCGSILKDVWFESTGIKHFSTVPGIELSNWAVNERFKEKYKEGGATQGLGMLLFEDFIIPIVKETARLVGARILYLFALPKERLVNYYSNALMFSRLEESLERELNQYSRPDYDEDCIFMYQVLSQE